VSRRESNLLWLKDVLEHLTACRQQLEWTADPEAVQVLTESMIRDLECCRRLCETLHQNSIFRQAV
jgi:hypothetical protein